LAPRFRGVGCYDVNGPDPSVVLDELVQVYSEGWRKSKWKVGFSRMPDPDVRDRILEIIKRDRSVAIQELADALGVTYEAIRQHIIALASDGLVARRVLRPSEKAVGRPNAVYSLTAAGDHLFPKRYDELASALIGAIGAVLDDDAMHAVLAAITDARVARWEPLLRGRMLERRVELMRSFYADGDPFMSAGVDEEGAWLVEKNCPYLNVAMEHPAICSTSVSAMTRLFECRVVRTERFQAGDRRCRFRILVDEPVDASSYGFRAEPPTE
jgi:predicted ArsR family transcriptional regulator